MFSLWALSSRAAETQTTPIYDGTTTYYDDFYLNIGVQQALQNQGIILNGIQYDYDVWLGADVYEGYCANYFLGICTDWRTRRIKDPFISGGVQLKDADGNIIASDTEYWTTERNWTSYSNTLNLPINGVEGYRPPNMGSFSASYELYDNVQLRDFNVTGRYVYDPCYLDPLYDPKCPGYTEAFLQKQLEEQLAQQQALMEEMMEQTAPVAEESTNESIQESISVVADVVSEPTVEIEQTKKSTGLTDDQKNALANADAQAKSAEKVASNSSQQSMESSEQMMEELTGISVDGSVVSSVISGDSASADVLTLDPTASAIEQFSFSVSTTQSVALSKTTQQTEQTVSEKEEEQEEEMVEQVAESNEAEDMQLAMMGFNPNFSAYQQPQMPDANFYKPKEIYEGQENYDNPNQRFFNGASDVLHQQLINLQYGR